MFQYVYRIHYWPIDNHNNHINIYFDNTVTILLPVNTNILRIIILKRMTIEQYHHRYFYLFLFLLLECYLLLLMLNGLIFLFIYRIFILYILFYSSGTLNNGYNTELQLDISYNV